MRIIEEEGIPAHSPIEQRWSAASSAPMSPASCPASARSCPADALHSWVGIIMYLPTAEPAARQAITDKCGGLI